MDKNHVLNHSVTHPAYLVPREPKQKRRTKYQPHLLNSIVTEIISWGRHMDRQTDRQTDHWRSASRTQKTWQLACLGRRCRRCKSSMLIVALSQNYSKSINVSHVSMQTWSNESVNPL